MDAEQIKAAVDAGKTVHWASHIYRVVRDSRGQYLIRCESGARGAPQYVGLTHRDGETLNGHPDEFWIAEYLSLEAFASMYVDWVNNFGTVERFASAYHISESVARSIIDHGRLISAIDLNAGRDE